jgi:tRNA(fMet)-specific endonuclease VapC
MQRIRRVGETNVLTSIVVVAELRYGAKKKASPRLLAQLEAVLDVLEIAPLDAPADQVYGEIRVQLERAGRPIGGNDLLIAAQALALECVVVTDSQREFERVEGLIVENWLRG